MRNRITIKCLICRNKAAVKATTSKGEQVDVCKKCNELLISGGLTKGDLHIALNSKLY